MDYGRSSSACGVELGGVYAETVALHYDNVLYDVPSWLSAPAVLNPVLSSETQCQHLCAAHPSCNYFSYEARGDGSSTEPTTGLVKHSWL